MGQAVECLLCKYRALSSTKKKKKKKGNRKRELKQKVHETSSQWISGWVQWYMPVMPAMLGSTNSRITVQASPDIFKILSPK
jgi:hypothetical protein